VQQKSVLGKGLASLLPGAAAPAEVATPPPAPVNTMANGAGAVAAGPAVPVEAAQNRDRHMGISLAPPEEIEVNPYQPRREFNEKEIDELADSIRVNGIIQPLLVRRGPNGYQLIAGERRLRAAKKAGLKQVPIVIRRSTDKEALELALIENIQRADLNCVDESKAYFQLMQEFSLTQEEVAERVGKERATVANALRLLRLSDEILENLKKGELSSGHGKALLSLEDAEQRAKLQKEILEKNLSVRQTEARAHEMKEPKTTGEQNLATQEPQTSVEARLSTLSQILTRHWTAKIEIKGGEKKGKIVFHYGSRTELERLLDRLQK